MKHAVIFIMVLALATASAWSRETKQPKTHSGLKSPPSSLSSLKSPPSSLLPSGGSEHSKETAAPLQLLYFTASWCGPCQLMKQKTWPSPIVQDALEPFAFQSIDVDAQQEVAKQWSVRSMPTYLVIDPEGEIELARMSGYMDSQRMAVWLRTVEAQARESLESMVKARLAAEKNWAALAPLLQENPSPDALRKGQEALHTLLQQRGNLPVQTVEDLDARLHAIAAKNPKHLAQGILHHDLQVRAYIARALAAREIHFDPWANKEAREKAYATFLQKNFIIDFQR